MKAVRSQDLPPLRRALLSWHRRHGQPAPWRESGDPYRVLIAAVMAQQTQMSRVLPKYESFLRAFPTVESLARAPTALVLREWEGMGYNMRALCLQRAARRAVRQDGFPHAAEQLQRFEGIGPCTAAVVSSFAFGEPVAAVDTNVERILRRLMGTTDAPSKAVEVEAQRVLSRRAPGRWNQAMMDLGALVCTARQPKCHACPLARWCRAKRSFSVRNGGRNGGRIAEERTGYWPARQEPFRGSRRYYRGRIVQELRDVPTGNSISMLSLRSRIPGGEGLRVRALRDIVDGLVRDGLVHVDGRGRVRLP